MVPDRQTERMRSTRGRLLLAGPNLRDPNFFRTVVLMLDHDAAGALGVVLNRPTDYPIVSALPQWAAAVCEPDVVFVGGPVAPENAIALAQLRSGHAEPEAWNRVAGDIGIVNLEASGPIRELTNLRIFAGYAGWAPGQLEGELDANAWIVLDSTTGDISTSMPQALWEDVLKRQPGSLAMLAEYPDEPAWN